MKIVGIIPARGGSKGVPRKNIKLLAGKPLIGYTINAAIKSKYIDKIIVSTEDSEIADISLSFGAEVINRPVELAQDDTKTFPVLVHAIKELEKDGYNPDIIVLLQPTSPLRDEIVIDQALEKLIGSDNDSIFTVIHKGITHGMWKRNLDSSITSFYNYHLRPRRQEEELHEKFYCENGALYAIRYDSFVKYSDFIGNNPDILVMNSLIDIDTQEDFEKAEKIIQNILDNLKKV